MTTTSSLWLGLTFLAGFFAVGIPYWDIPYSGVSLPGTLYTVALLVVVVGAACARLFGRTGVVAATFVVGSAVPSAVIARVFVETLANPTSHNLWPFEVVIAGVIGFACSLVGALGASLIKRISGKG